jgi:hypothetical protein
MSGILNSTVRKASFLPLRDAVLCSDCNFVSADEEGVCPVCRGRSLTNLADQLRRVAQRSSATPPPAGFRAVLQMLGLRRKQDDGGFAFSPR